MGRFTDWLINGEKSTKVNNNFDRDITARRRRLPIREAEEIAPTENEMNVAIYAPRTYKDVQRVIDHLKRREPVVVELRSTDRETVQRIMDFISGAVYGLSGSVGNISDGIYLLTPSGVTITTPIDYEGKTEK